MNHKENERLTHVGPAAPMGQLLRRYWMPVGAAAELETKPTKVVRVLGEDLVLYKDRSGVYGLIQQRCPHRQADLSYGIVDHCGLRCSYHGWLFNHEGHCLQQPFDDRVRPDRNFKQQIQLTAYPVEAHAGLLWAYFGPPPAPALPKWRNFQKKGYKHICFAQLPCNWLQAMENSFDQVHNEWMHDKWAFYLRDGEIPKDRWQIEKFLHREFEHGWTAEVQYVGVPDFFPDRVILWPNYNFVHLFEWYVPIDDFNTLMILWHNEHLRAEAPFKQDRIPYWTASLTEGNSNNYRLRPPRNQDVAVWASQGRIVDRTRECLGSSDAGVIMFRKRLLKEIDKVQRGEEPKAVVRDPEKYFLMLPEPVPSGPSRDGIPGALSTPADMRTIGYLAGFPSDIAAELHEIRRQRGEDVLRATELKRSGWKIGGESFNRDNHFVALRRSWVHK